MFQGLEQNELILGSNSLEEAHGKGKMKTWRMQLGRAGGRAHVRTGNKRRREEAGLAETLSWGGGCRARRLWKNRQRNGDQIQAISGVQGGGTHLNRWSRWMTHCRGGRKGINCD